MGMIARLVADLTGAGTNSPEKQRRLQRRPSGGGGGGGDDPE